MKKQKQLFRHNPGEGVFGDCFRTSIACILGLDAHDVPHVYDDGSTEGVARMRAWLHGRGLALAQMMFECDLDTLFSTMEWLNPGVPYLLSGTSKNGCGHVVVACGGEIVWDPSLDDSGIIGPMEDGRYWVEFLTVAPRRGEIEEFHNFEASTVDS